MENGEIKGRIDVSNNGVPFFGGKTFHTISSLVSAVLG